MALLVEESYEQTVVTWHMFFSLSALEGSQKKGEADSRVWAECICSKSTFLEVHFVTAAASKLSELNPGLNNWNHLQGLVSISSPESRKCVVQREGLPARQGHVASVSSLSFRELT